MQKGRKTFEGNLPDEAYNTLRVILNNELKTTVPENNHILIHYEQRAGNCIAYNNYSKRQPIVIENIVDSDNTRLSKFQTMPFWLYNVNSFFAEHFQDHPEYQLDSGYFKDNIFKLNDNCSAFFLLKFNGAFMIHYGEDYMSEVYNFLKR